MDRDRLARHEAAHVVVARLEGVRVVSVSLEPTNEDNVAQTALDFDAIRADRPRYWRACLRTGLAGVEQVFLESGQISAAPGQGRARGDYADALLVIEEAAKEGIALGLRAERRWVRRLLRRHWPDLERIAAELLEDEGVRLFDGHGRRLILRDTARVGAWLVAEVSS